MFVKDNPWNIEPDDPVELLFVSREEFELNLEENSFKVSLVFPEKSFVDFGRGFTFVPKESPLKSELGFSGDLVLDWNMS